MKREKDESLIKLGINIRNLRQKLNMSQEALALEAELDRTYMGGVERGERNVSVKNIIKIARTLKCTPSEIVENII